MVKKFKGSIATKILSVLALFILIQVVVYIVINDRTSKIEQATENVFNINNLTVVVFEINKEILEIQRDISVYSASGSVAIFEKIKNNYGNIQNRLIDAEKLAPQGKVTSLLNSMQSLVISFGQSIDNLQKRYEQKSKIIDEELPNTFELSISRLAALSQQSRTLEKGLAISRLINSWHALQRNAMLFLTQRDYAKKQKVNFYLKEINQQIELFPDASNNEKNTLDEIKTLTAQFKSLFSNGIQANRNYLTLINIVIAGDSAEFSALAQHLREEALLLLDDIHQSSNESINTAKDIITASLVISIVLFVLFALFFHFHIVQAINRITLAFRAILNEDFSVRLSDTNREDEIGILANAANKFRVLNENLIEAKQVAEETSRIKSEFLANMSHEIRTPMNGILGMVQLVSNTKLDTEQKRMIDVINSSGNSLLVILNDILDLSKIDSDKMLLEERRFKLSDMVFELEQMFNSQVKERHIQLIFPSEIFKDIDFVIGDETRIKQVLMNLLSNAFKFTESGSISLNIELKQKSASEVVLLFSITDTGIGISQENISTLFDAFTQADTSTTRRYGGTGLGLTISSKLLNLMGSSLQVSSELGQGSRFYFELILNTAVDEGHKALSEQVSNILPSEVNILIIEDTPINQVIIEGFLAAIDIGRIDIADNGKIGLEMCNENTYDLIFMDIQMPVMDGITATTKIRGLPQYKDTPIIAVTANFTDNDKAIYFEAGITQIINKPVEFDSITSAVDEHLLKRT